MINSPVTMVIGFSLFWKILFGTFYWIWFYIWTARFKLIIYCKMLYCYINQPQNKQGVWYRHDKHISNNFWPLETDHIVTMGFFLQFPGESPNWNTQGIDLGRKNKLNTAQDGLNFLMFLWETTKTMKCYLVCAQSNTFKSLSHCKKKKSLFCII